MEINECQIKIDIDPVFKPKADTSHFKINQGDFPVT